MGTILSQVVGKLLGSGPVLESQCNDVRCCTSTQRVVDPRCPTQTGPGKSVSARALRHRCGVSSVEESGS